MEFLKIAEAAETLKMTKGFIRKLILENRVPFTRAGRTSGAYLVNPEQVRNALQQETMKHAA